MSEASATPLVIESLVRVRRRLRVLLVADGLARLMAITVAVFAISAALDWCVHFPTLMRAGGALGFVVWAAAWIWRRVWRPATRPVSLDQLALALGRFTPGLRDRLASAASFLLRGGDGSDAMWRRVVSNADVATQRIPLTRALTARRAVRSCMAALVFGAAFATATRAAPDAVRTGWRRMGTPFAGAEWPKRVEIEALSGNLRVPYGESAMIEMRLVRGDDPAVRGFVVWREDGGWNRQMMRRDDDGIYRLPIDGVVRDRKYSIEAEDNWIGEPPFAVTVVRRPTVESARFVFMLPGYVGATEPVVQPLESARATTTAGSVARFELTSSRALAGGDGAGRLVFDDGSELRLARSDENTRSASVQFIADKSAFFQIDLVDAGGLPSRGGPRYRLEVSEDQPPSVSMTRPESTAYATPTGEIHLAAMANDDFGVEDLRILTIREPQAGNEPQSASRATTTTSPDAVESDVGAVKTYSVNRKRARADGRVDLSPLRLSPGDNLTCLAEARDNFRLGNERHDPVRSRPVRIRIVTPQQLNETVAQDVDAIRHSLVDTIAQLQSVRTQTDALDADPRKGAALDESGRRVAGELSGDLRALNADLRRAAVRLAETAAKIEQNGRTTGSDGADPLHKARTTCEAAARMLKSRGMDPLMWVAQTVEADPQHRDLVASVAGQDDVLASLRRAVQSFDQWNEMGDAVRRMRDLLDRQETLLRETDRLAATTAGRSPESMDRVEQALIARVAGTQSQLGDEAAALLDHVAALSQRLMDSERQAGESLARAHDAGLQLRLVENMAEAVESIRANRGNQSRDAELGAIAALRAMLSATEVRPERALAELTRQLQDLQARLRKIIAVQKDLVRRTKAAPSSDDEQSELFTVSRRQRTLRSTTMELADRMSGESEQAQSAKRVVQAAAGDMEEAYIALDDGTGAKADASQQAALGKLRTAATLLSELERKTQQELGEQSLAAIREALAAVRAAQVTLRDGTATVQAKRTNPHQLSRADIVRVRSLAKDQKVLAERMTEAKEKMTSAVVYQYAAERIIERMESATVALAGHDLKEAIIAQQAVIAGLDQLLEALREPKDHDKNDPRFAAEGGGDGAGRPTQSKPIPNLAELKLLRLLQSDVNDRTAAIDADETHPPSQRAGDRKEIEQLASDQTAIQTMATRMINEAAKAGGGP